MLPMNMAATANMPDHRNMMDMACSPLTCEWSIPGSLARRVHHEVDGNRDDLP